MFKKAITGRSILGYHTWITRTPDILRSPLICSAASCGPNRNIAHRTSHDKATWKATTRLSDKPKPAPVVTGWQRTPIWELHAGGLLSKPMVTSQQPANHEMRYQNKVQGRVLEHGLGSLTSSRDNAKRAHDQGTRSRQDMGILSSPRMINAYAKGLERCFMKLPLGSRLGHAVLGFSDLERLYHIAGFKMDAINISTNITSLSHVWLAAQDSHSWDQSDHDKVSKSIEAVYQQSLQQLQPMMQPMGAQAISNIMWSSAKLNLNPDERVPGTVNTLTTRFLRQLSAADNRQRPNAQDAANLVWALATMHHAAATKDLLDPVCSHFGSLTQHPDARQRPNAQDVANMIWAVAELKHSLEDDRLLDDLCMYMHSLLQSQDASARPTAQSVTNVLWALAQMKHAPPSEAASAMVDHLVALCQVPGLQPKPQDISNCFLACAELGLSLHPAQVQILLKHLLGLHITSPSSTTKTTATSPGV